MTREEIIEVMIIERNCVERQDTPLCDRHCEKCDLCLPTDRVVKAYEQVIDILHEQPCDDTISREAVIAEIDKWYDNNRGVDAIEDLIIAINYNLPSVQPSRKGHWIKTPLLTCDSCEKINKGGIESNFCPNCGADMREKE